LLLAAGFYGYAALRGTRWAASALSLCVAAMSVVAIDSIKAGWMQAPHPGPLAIAGLLQLVLALGRPTAARLMFAATCLSASIALAVPVPNLGLPDGDVRLAIFGHLMAASMLGLGAFFETPIGRTLRAFGVLGAFFFAAIVIHPEKLPQLPLA